jgi:hypothetical protein
MRRTEEEEELNYKTRIETERRTRYRFGIRRELRYKLVKGRTVVAMGAGHTIDMGSRGVAFYAQDKLRPGARLELSISWPALLDQSSPIQLIVFGRVLRRAGRTAVCTVNRYEFRIANPSRTDAWVGPDSMLERWAGQACAVGA